ncbi:hypothetical protein [Dactylosporangium sp. NPDC000521]|uniref:hypothetical protein n=1 Tax=Dactylosporangium sp. NPDC000521 TaxID=3363975 RepID=UPI0036C2EF42
MTTRREAAAHASAAAAIARATAHVPPPDDDWPEPIPVDTRPPSTYVTPDIARQIRLEAEESRNG